jgi:hypothetical protein
MNLSGVIEGLPFMDAWPILQAHDGYVWISAGFDLPLGTNLYYGSHEFRMAASAMDGP